jgi:hypothetical protein
LTGAYFFDKVKCLPFGTSWRRRLNRALIYKEVMTMGTSMITRGQWKQVRRMLEDAGDTALEKLEAEGFTKDQLQAGLMNSGEVQASIVELLCAKFRALSHGAFVDEEVESSYGYFSGYTKPRGITEQTNILRKLMPGIGFANEKLAEAPILSNSEGWFAIPRWQSIGKTYEEALQKVLDLLNKQRKGRFYNYREGRFGARYLLRHERTEKAIAALGEEQKGYDILVVAAQFGLKHRGRSVRRARAVFTKDEFGLGAFEIACMLLTHPERLKNYEDLWIDCSGDEYAPEAAGVWSCAPYFDFSDGAVYFDAGGVGDADGFFGSASGFAK